MAPVLAISAELLGNIADDIISIDRAMKWGFGWKTGPFETWDAIGLEKSVGKMEAEGIKVPEWVKEMLAQGHTSFYKEVDGAEFYYSNGDYHEIHKNPKEIDLKFLKKQGHVIKKNSGASLIDLGDGVVLLEFNSPNNAIGFDIIQFINLLCNQPHIFCDIKREPQDKGEITNGHLIIHS